MSAGAAPQRRTRNTPGRPGPLKIKSSDPPVDIENLANQIEPRADSRFHCRRIDLVEQDATSRRLGVVVATTGGHRQRPFDERGRERPSFGAREMSELPRGINTETPNYRACHPGG